MSTCSPPCPTALEQLITDAGHLTAMLPKCHPELNPIEQYWAALKEYLRRVCGYSFPDLKANVPKAIRDGCPLDQIQRYFRRADRFVELYRFEAENGVELPGPVREFAMKKYKRHRTVPTGLLNDVTADLAAKQAALKVKLEEGRGTKSVVKAKLIKVEGALEAMSGLTAAPVAV